ncbi:MAG: hypothetical protein LBI79_02975 [Nitrososphaerota archaeon]|jgi:hypothetical protein|nr:hypothetical protein [Nitrososphaerota archaeon]
MVEKIESDYKKILQQIDHKTSSAIEKLRLTLDALRDAATQTGKAVENSL